MATPVLICGTECGVANGPHYAGHGGSGAGSQTSSKFRSGLTSLRENPTNATSFWPFLTLASTTDWVVRMYVWFDTLPNVDCAIFMLGSVGPGVYFTNSDDTLRVGTAPGSQGSSGVVITTGQWYRIDFKQTSTTLDAQVDGVSVAQLGGSFSAQTQLWLGDNATNHTVDKYTDDIMVSQTLADYPLGPGYSKRYQPNADGTHNVAGANDFERTLTGTDITNSTTDAYTLITPGTFGLPDSAGGGDWINGVAPPNATDYVEWQYEDSSEPTAPVGVEAMFAHHDAGGAGTNNFTVTLREHAGGTSANIFTGTTNQGSVLTNKRALFLTVPGTSDPWTTTKFNALRSRFLVSDASPDPYIDAVMLEVGFTEVVAGARVPKVSQYTQLLAH